jgi:hypothetical protein
VLDDRIPAGGRLLTIWIASIICSIFDIQDELNISGNIAEIGVFNGKLLILIRGISKRMRNFGNGCYSQITLI